MPEKCCVCVCYSIFGNRRYEVCVWGVVWPALVSSWKALQQSARAHTPSICSRVRVTRAQRGGAHWTAKRATLFLANDSPGTLAFFPSPALVVILTLTGCLATRWYRKRNQQLSMNFENPVYRKTTTPNVAEPKGLAQFMPFNRTSSHTRLVDADENEARQRMDSTGSDCGAEHLYQAVSIVFLFVSGHDLSKRVSQRF